MSSTAGLTRDVSFVFSGPSAASHPEAPAFPVPQVLDRCFLSDELCLSFAATVAAWDGPRVDRLFSDGRRREWLQRVGLPVPAGAPTPEEWSQLARLRVAVYELATARARGEDAAEPWRSIVNDARGERGPIEGIGASFERLELEEPSWRGIAGAIADSAVTCLSGPWGHRVRVCEGRPCSHLFVDRTATGSRRWCVTASCGNRERVRAHRAAQVRETA